MDTRHERVRKSLLYMKILATSNVKFGISLCVLNINITVKKLWGISNVLSSKTTAIFETKRTLCSDKILMMGLVSYNEKQLFLKME